MTTNNPIPESFVLARTTHVFDENTAPPGLMKAHRVAKGVWGRLVVHAGTLGFVFEDELDNIITVSTGHAITIPPGKPHQVELDGPVRFAVEFHRQSTDSGGDLESNGLV